LIVYFHCLIYAALLKNSELPEIGCDWVWAITLFTCK